MVNFSVEAYGGEPFERILRRFSTKTKRSGILREAKKRRFYVKPSVQKKLDRAKSTRRVQKAERIAQMTTAEKANQAAKQKSRRGQR